MSKKNYTTEQIIIHLREVEVLCSKGKTIEEATRIKNRKYSDKGFFFYF